MLMWDPLYIIFFKRGAAFKHPEVLVAAVTLLAL